MTQSDYENLTQQTLLLKFQDSSESDSGPFAPN